MPERGTLSTLPGRRSCAGCGRADVGLHRLMVVTASGVSWTWALCADCYEPTLTNCRNALDARVVGGVQSTIQKKRPARAGR